MNPLLASPRLNTVAGQDSELVFLEGLLEDDCKCEANHVILPCTGKVVGVHLSQCTGNRYLKCLNAVKFSEDAMKRGSKCQDCDKLSSECWIIRPI